MVGIVIATHGEFANGVFMSAQMIFGEQENVKACTLMPDEGPDDIKRKMQEAIDSFDNKDQVLFLVDLWSGTPFNQANSLISGNEDKWAIVTGLNLPMLIEAYSSRFSSESAHEIAQIISKTAKEGVRIKPEDLESVSEDDDLHTDKSPTHKGAIPEGTVIGDGKIKYVLARIDTRLLHGQVATSWTKSTRPDRIIAVSDSVANDTLRKSMITEAAPPGVKANVIPIRKLIEVDKDPRFGNTKALILFETPQDALEAIEGGVQIKELNLGSMAHSVGKVNLTTSVSMDQDDVKTFEKLLDLGVKIDVRKVPNDSPENFDNIMKKAKNEIAKQRGK